MPERKSFQEYDSDDHVNKLVQKSRDSPFVPIGMAGFFAVAGYGLYNFRKRTVSASVYLMQLRVAAQGTVVGTLCVGLIYSMFNQYYLKKQPVTDTNQSHQH